MSLDMYSYLLILSLCNRQRILLSSIKYIVACTSLTMSVRATLQPSVPAPSKRHLVDTTLSKSREGTSRQRINFRLRSTDDSASLTHTQTHTHTHTVYSTRTDPIIQFGPDKI